MMRETWYSTIDNFKQKISNPFLATYIFIWTVRNWELVYRLFNFDEETTLDVKVNFINTYYKEYEIFDFLLSIVVNISLVLLLLLLTYTMLSITKGIVHFFEVRITPNLLSRIGKGRTVLVEVYIEEQKKVESLQRILDKERTDKNQLEDEIERLSIKIKDDIKSIPDKSDVDKVEKNNIDEIYIRNKGEESFAPEEIEQKENVEIKSFLEKKSTKSYFGLLIDKINKGHEIYGGVIPDKYISYCKALELIFINSKGKYEISGKGSAYIVKFMNDFIE